MNHEKIIKDILDALDVHRSYTGYDYVVYGLKLSAKDPSCIDHITKSLYIDISSRYNTTWTCVEKNIRTVVNAVWDSPNTELLEVIFGKSFHRKKPTNKEFFKRMTDYIRNCEHFPDYQMLLRCPISNTYCESLNHFCRKLIEHQKDTQPAL